MRSLLDGHIILSRSLAEQGHFPAIDVPRSVSRQAYELTDGPHRAAAGRASALLSVYEGARTLIETGVYIRGGNADIDEALDRRPKIIEFLKQKPDDLTPFDVCRHALGSLAPTEARA
jgi:flagellum-specific ATP synthase